MNGTQFGLTGVACVSLALLVTGCAGPAAGQTDSADEGTAATGATGNEQQAWTERLVDAPSKPEDLIALPGTDSMIISGMSADPGKDGGTAGHLYLMDKNTEELTEIWPDREHSTELNEELYADCPAPPELDIASPHGIGLEQQDDGSSTLYVVNHGGREAVEVFQLEPGTAGDIELTWSGCELLPDGTFGNGVVPDPRSDGFFVTHYFNPADMMTGFEAAFAGENTGYVLHSDPAAGWTRVPGSDMSAPNGIAVSDDGSQLYVAGWGSRDVKRFEIDKEGQPETLELDFMPDNLRWTADGTLLATGQDIRDFETFRGFQTGEVVPAPGYEVLEIDPADFSAERIAAGDPNGFTNPTTALEVDGDILIGSVDGDKIMRLSRP